MGSLGTDFRYCRHPLFMNAVIVPEHVRSAIQDQCHDLGEMTASESLFVQRPSAHQLANVPILTLPVSP